MFAHGSLKGFTSWALKRNTFSMTYGTTDYVPFPITCLNH